VLSGRIGFLSAYAIGGTCQAPWEPRLPRAKTPVWTEFDLGLQNACTQFVERRCFRYRCCQVFKIVGNRDATPLNNLQGPNFLARYGDPQSTRYRPKSPTNCRRDEFEGDELVQKAMRGMLPPLLDGMPSRHKIAPEISLCPSTRSKTPPSTACVRKGSIRRREPFRALLLLSGSTASA
jgi:hypothetical protein